MVYGALVNNMRAFLKCLMMITIALSILTIAQAQLTGPISIQFQIIDFTTAQPIQAASVSFTGPISLDGKTDANGTATLSISPGTYTLTISKDGCTQLGPLDFSVDPTSPPMILGKLQCQQASAQPTETPVVLTDGTVYQYNETVTWNATGFSPGAYLQACITTTCAPVQQADRYGNATGTFLITPPITPGNQTLTIRNITTQATNQTQITIHT